MTAKQKFRKDKLLFCDYIDALCQMVVLKEQDRYHIYHGQECVPSTIGIVISPDGPEEDHRVDYIDADAWMNTHTLGENLLFLGQHYATAKILTPIILYYGEAWYTEVNSEDEAKNLLAQDDAALPNKCECLILEVLSATRAHGTYLRSVQRNAENKIAGFGPIKAIDRSGPLTHAGVLPQYFLGMRDSIKANGWGRCP